MNKKVITAIFAWVALSTSAFSSTLCEGVFDKTPLVSSGKFSEMAESAPEAAASWKKSVIVMCDAAFDFGKSGGSAEDAAFVPAKEMKMASPIESLLSATSISVVMSAWYEGRKDK